MLPSGGKRFFVHIQHRGERVWKSIGDTAAMDVREARSRAVTMLAAIRLGEDPPRDPAETLFEAVAETAFERRSRVLEGGNAGGEPGLPAQADPPALRGTAGRRH